MAYDRAGDWILQDTIEGLGLAEYVSLIKNNIDHETDATFGCHENYLVSRNFPFSYKGLGKLIPFLVTRDRSLRALEELDQRRIMTDGYLWKISLILIVHLKNSKKSRLACPISDFSTG